jgi:hypothetical protein
MKDDEFTECMGGNVRGLTDKHRAERDADVNTHRPIVALPPAGWRSYLRNLIPHLLRHGR